MTGEAPVVFGWRKRIGYISPSVLEIITHDFARIAPAGVGLVGISSNIPFWAPEHFEKATAGVVDAAKYLGSREVDYVIYAGVPLITTRGKGADVALIAEITQACGGRPATTSIRAAIDAIRHLSLKRIAIASPYPANLHSTVLAFLRAHGIEIVREASMDVHFLKLHAVAPHLIYRFASQVLATAPEADGLYIPCPQWQAAEIVDVLERDCGKPIVAGDPADFWAAFRALDIRDPIRGHGRLLATLSDGPRN